MNIKRWMEPAIELAECSDLTNWRLGAVIVRGNNIIGRGYNRFSAEVERLSQQFGLDDLWSLHAEMDALLDVQNTTVNNATMFVAGIKHNGNGVYCRPCDNCMKVLRQTGLATIYYQTKEGIEAIFFE